MRTITTDERDLIGGARYAVHLRVEVQNADGTWKNLCALGTPMTGAIDWVDAVSWSFAIDDPVMSGTLALRRDATVDGETVSLAPFLAASGLNVDDSAAYAPLLNAGRQLRISAACVAPGATSLEIDAAMRVMLVGKIDAVEWAADPIEVRFRDLGAYLQDATLRGSLLLGAADGSVSAAMVMQEILDAVPPPPSGIPTVYEPTPILFAVTKYRQEPGALFDAVRNVALQAGGDLRYAFDASDVFRLTFTRPDRTKTVADFTLPPSEYLAVRAMNVDDDGVRNDFESVYTDAATRTLRTVSLLHTDSYDEFGPRFFRLVEPAASLIDTEAEATRLLEDIAADLALPMATHALESLFLPFVELGDLVEFPDNGVHYDAPQSLAVVGGTHTFGAGGVARTTLTTRGTPAGAYRAWLEREGGLTATPALPAPVVGTLYGEGSAFGGAREGACWQAVQFDLHTEEIVTHVEESPDYPAPVPDVHDANTEAKRVRRLAGTRASAEDWATLLYLGTTLNAGKTAVTFGVSGRQVSQRATRYALASDPSDAYDPGTLSGLTVERRAGANVLTITRGTAASAAAPVWCVVRRNYAVLDYFPITTEAGAASTLAPAASIEWVDDGLEAADSYDYEVLPVVFAVSAAEARPYAASGPIRAYGVEPQVPVTPTDPPVETPPTTTAPPASIVPAPVFTTHGGVQTPYYGDAIDHDGAGWVRVAWSKPAAAYGVALEKTYRSDGTGWFEVTFATGATFDNRVAGAYESGYYRLVSKSATFAYLSISPSVYYTSPGDTVTRTSGGGGRTSYIQ